MSTRASDLPPPLSLSAPAADDEPLPAGRTYGGLRLRSLALLTSAFWAYAALSAVIYAAGMSATIAALTDKPLFAPWYARIAQHVLLLPVLVACYAASLRIDWRPLHKALPLQLALAAGFALLANPAMWLSNGLFGHEGVDFSKADWAASKAFAAPTLALWLSSFVDFLVKYGFGLALLTGFALYVRARDTQARLVALDQQVTAARLAALRMQLSPHTLFNLLHTIRGQIGWDPRAAQTMIVQLSDLLRRLLNAGEREYSTLVDEIRFVQLYLELQQKRFADRLSLDLPAEDSLPATWVPSLILQPLVENAVAHGLAGHEGPVHVSVAVERRDEDVVMRVTNTTRAELQRGPDGVGLRNVRTRLEVQFGARASFRAGPDGEARWVTEIRLPMLRGAGGPG